MDDVADAWKAGVEVAAGRLEYRDAGELLILTGSGLQCTFNVGSLGDMNPSTVVVELRTKLPKVLSLT